jgi:hypothetical protein
MDEIRFGLIDEYENGKMEFGAIKELILSEIIRNIDSLDFLAHPLGFAMTKIRETSAGSLRLHLWLKNQDFTQVPNLPIHDHIFDFKSLILTGCISNCVYEVIEGMKPNRSIYRTHYVGDTSVITKCDLNVELKQLSLKTESTGNVYHFKNKIFHSSDVPKSTTTITFLETMNKQNSLPRVVGPIDGSASYTYKRSKIDSGIVKNSILNI